eukprot:TRINITY_DN20429_c0_g2_i1.p1 TRINITY_DN20429_c0_g2~~TRINITY_DN20429_c0_g2_i1.p1  ORF type:complete len:458 (+),score=86.68 TRINITY_DN20429_c0_g2_i1:226-1599(+)
MIIYHKRFWGLQLLTRLYGSAFPRALPFALLSTAITLLLKLLADPIDDGHKNHRFEGDDQWLLELWNHPYPYQAFAFVVGFIIIFRSNFGYARYMEGRTQFQLMTSKWADGVVLALNFDKYNQADSDQIAKYKMTVFANTFVHLVSLLHAVASLTLRSDYDLDNLNVHNTEGDAPPKDPVNLRRTRQYMKKLQQAAPEDTANNNKKDAVNYGFIGVNLFDIFLLWSGEKAMQTLHKAMPLSIVGGLNDDEFAALGGNAKRDDYTHGLHQGNFDNLKNIYVPGPNERVHTVMNWVHQFIMERRKQGGLKIEPPIITRLYQVFSEGMLGFEQCRKFSDTPFPFPWAQAVLVFLIIYTVTVPFVIGAFIKSVWLAAVVTFIAVLTYWTLNEVARDLEDPFWYDPNDLPLSYYQYAFNERLLVISRTKRPKSDTEKLLLGSKSNMPVVETENSALEMHKSI